MRKWKKWTLAALVAIIALCSAPTVPAAFAADKVTAFEPVTLSSLKNGQSLYKKIGPFVTAELQMSEEDAEDVTVDSFYEVDLGNYPKGYTRQFIAFVYNYDWIELVLVATNDDASKIKLLDRASASDYGDMFLNLAKLDFYTNENYITVWSQAPFSAYQSEVELEWAGDRFYFITHEYDDPTARYYEEKAKLLKAKDINGLIKLYNEVDPFYPGSYVELYTLSAPTLKLAHQMAQNAAQKKNVKTALKYLEYGLEQYAEAFGTWNYTDGTLVKKDIAGSADDYYLKQRLNLAVYVGILNDYAYYLSLDGQNKKAKLILDNVVKLVPDRTVAYLNLADVEWTLGQRTAAKAHYKQYWKLLGSKASSTAPKRVQERMNAK
ncbi:hypothetical protein [Cohnella terricola]|uniref:Tetratricopeptide repeat protein n=1 Tax=Cohnella terricola TaxID=1289167 RepID=A0A559JTQ6_9BACL|nr:hypothetical protein [Cohnella terricola]TVY03220.1 hypothetical protein FPZ45_04915 [Cohnella terricola]